MISNASNKVLWRINYLKSVFTEIKQKKTLQKFYSLSFFKYEDSYEVVDPILKVIQYNQFYSVTVNQMGKDYKR